MIEVAKKLPKYGTIKLAIGDLIAAWEKQQETINNISWNAFLECLDKYLKKDIEMLNMLSNELLGINWIDAKDRNKAYSFMFWQIDQIKKEKDSVEQAKRIETNKAVINVFEQIKQDVKLDEKAHKYIKSEIRKYLYDLVEYFDKECTTFETVMIMDNKGKKKPAKDSNGNDTKEAKYNVSKFYLKLTSEIRKLNDIKK